MQFANLKIQSGLCQTTRLVRCFHTAGTSLPNLQDQEPGGSLQVWAGFSKVNITFKTSTFHTWDLNWILTGWGLDYVNWFNAWRAFGLFLLKLKCVCALMSVMIVDVVQEKRYSSDFWVQLRLRQQLCNFQKQWHRSNLSSVLRWIGEDCEGRLWLKLCGGSDRGQWHHGRFNFTLRAQNYIWFWQLHCLGFPPLVIITSRGKQSIVRFSTQPWSGPSRNQCQSPTCTSRCCSSFGGYGSHSRLKRHSEKTVEISAQRGSCSLTCSDVVVDAFHWDGRICDSPAL